MVLAENGETSFGFQMQGANLSDIESAYLVTNTGTKTIKDWSAAFRMNGEIDNIWNAQASVVSWIHRR